MRYTAPLYKTNRLARGRISYERGPGAQYKFISSGPDQRRSESTGADGITRGSYSYLDDKGVQRTVEYIAGAGIGYRVVKTTTGPGSHLVPRPFIPDFNAVSPQSNDISDIDGSGFKTAESGSVIPNRGSGGQNNVAGNSDGNVRERDPLHSTDDHSSHGSSNSFSSGPSATGNAFSSNSASGSHKPTGQRGGANSAHDTDNSHRPTSSSTRGSTRYSGNKNSEYSPNNRPNAIASLGPPYITRDHFGLTDDSDNDWAHHRQDSTLIKNAGDWYVGLPPGSAVRAHVQSIDLLPLGGRPPSPSDALRRDEQRSKQY